MLLLRPQPNENPAPCTSSTEPATHQTREAEQGADPVPPNPHVSYVAVGGIEAEAPVGHVEAQ